jgi:hypothetical protein
MPQDITSVRIDAELVSKLRDFGPATEVKITRRIEKAVATTHDHFPHTDTPKRNTGA